MSLMPYRRFDDNDVPWVDGYGMLIDCNYCHLPLCDEKCAVKLFHNAVECIKNGDDDTALKCLTKAHIDAPKTFAIHYLKGVIYERQKKMDEALASFERAHSIRPHDPKALWGLALIYAELGQYVLADEFCSKYDAEKKDHALDQLRKDILAKMK